jgi:hypothetical protein
MKQFPDYKYVSMIPIKGIEGTIYNLAINKAKLGVGLLLSRWLEPV